MATYTMLSNGSKGEEVKKLQTSLINAGYSVGSAGADGIYGNDTANAVKQYQKANGLSVDGIAGDQTLGKLYGSTASPAATTQKVTTPAPAQTTQTTKTASEQKFEYEPYKESDTVKQAQALLQQQMSQKPGEYVSSWQSQIDDTLNKILNREKFSYDMNADALYQQYKDHYTTQGKQAMMDTMGQAAALTGGYGNSYAQTVGQQTYQGYLQELNNIVPELYQLALDQYNSEGDELKDQYTLFADREAMDYDRYRDQLGDWQTERDYLSNRYDAERDYDYGKYSDERGFAYDQYSDDRAMDYQRERDKVADEQWQAEFDEAKRQYDQEYALAQNKSSGSSGGSGGSGSSGGYDDSVDSDTEQFDSEIGVSRFKDSIMTRSEYYNTVGGRHGSDTEDQYEQYIEIKLDNWLDNGQLDEAGFEQLYRELILKEG